MIVPAGGDYLSAQAPASNYDSANYPSWFVVGRGDLVAVRRYNCAADCRPVGESSLTVHNHAINELEGRCPGCSLDLDFGSSQRNIRKLSLTAFLLNPVRIC